MQGKYWIAMLATAAVITGTTIYTTRRLADSTSPNIPTTSTPAWAVAPHIADTDLPAVGRSLFDEVVAESVGDASTHRIPFPFSAFMQRLADKAGCPNAQISSNASCLKAVLIPLGRSLQRTAASPDFFAYPRVVVAVTDEPASATSTPTFLKDRLYLGYHERAEVIEVISYNETAGRFEFQIVKNYRAGATPQVQYANRSVCTSCHQNHAPIFSRQVWEETNANPAIAKRLKATGKNFYGIDVERGVDIPNAIDDATDRANQLAVAQKLWRDGCAAQAAIAQRCRAAVLQASLEYRMNQERGFPDQAATWQETAALINANARRYWPHGLAISDPDIPNRNPLQAPYPDAALPIGLPLAHVPARFEPLLTRAPLEVWNPAETNFAQRAVVGVATLLAQSDVRAIQHLAAKRPQALTDAIQQLAADENGVLTDGPFRRRAVMLALSQALGQQMTSLANAAAKLPSARVVESNEPVPTLALENAPRELRLFYPYCAACHQTSDASPPNFLYGNLDHVAANLQHCAARIYFRLNMWRIPEGDRAKTPMPPRTAFDRLKLDPIHFATGRDFSDMSNYVATLWRAQGVDVPTIDQLNLKDYETLKPCLH